MPRTIQCTNCGIVLNLPNVPAGKRLKCPKCGAKFQVGTDDLLQKSAEMPSAHDASPDTSQVFPPGHGDFDLPTASGDLRETFDLPLMSEGEAAPAKKPARQTSDALALFDDAKPKPKRPASSEARKQARRCPTCGGVVPVGMSICGTCGLDLETGMRVGLDDDDLVSEAPVRGPSAPIPLLAVGAICFLGSLLMAVACLMQAAQGIAGWIYFVPVCLFGVFAAVQLLRGKSLKLLLVALTLAAMIDVVALIAMPIITANMEVEAVQARPNNSDSDDEGVIIPSVQDRLDTRTVMTGIVLLMGYAGVCAYLLSPSARRHFTKV